MVKKRVLMVLVVLGLFGLFGAGFFTGLDVGKKLSGVIVVSGVNNLETGKPVSVDFGIFWQAWQMISDNYLRNKDVKSEDMVRGAIGGLVESLKDPYSQFFSPSDNKKFQEDIQGNFGGIGAELGIKKNKLVIVAPLKDTPASRAGLLPGDQIIKIDSTSTAGIAIEQAVSLIRGPENTTVTLTIFREDWSEPKDFKLVRSNIVVPIIDEEKLDNNITHISLHSFNGNTEERFYQAMTKALAGGSRGLILDLRNNPGGFLEVAVDLGGWFLPKGSLVVSEAGRNGPPQEFRVNGSSAFLKVPVVVLINGGSASASEILAGALHDIRGIKLVGETSFGKGTVQQLLPLSDGSSIKLTIAHWILPSGHILDHDGLKPDVEVKLTDDDIKNKKDPQLDKATEILKAEIAK